MKKIVVFSIFCASVLFGSVSCVKPSKFNALQTQFDSLKVVHENADADLIALTECINTLTSSIDSISFQENLIKLGVDEKGRKFSVSQQVENLNQLKDIIDRQRERISELDKVIKNSKNEVAQLNTLVTNLYSQLDEKEKDIERMQEELANQKLKVTELTTQVDELTTSNQEKSDIIDAQQQTLNAQERLLNKGYFIISGRKELQQLGLISALSTKLNVAAMKTSMFTEVDIREFTDITISAKSLNILTQNPSSAYTVTDNGDGTFTLSISSPSEFWSESQYLVILIK